MTKLPSRWLHAFAVLLAAATFVLIFAGAKVTSNRAGLAVPDWPTSYGYPLLQFPFAKMVGGIFYEHGHRLIASAVGFLTMLLAIWLLLAEKRNGVRRLGLVALAAVIIQGLLGGLTVIYFLPPAISIAHAGLAEAFFCITIALAMMTSRRWFDSPTTIPHARLFQRLAVATTLIIYLQILLGAAIRHGEQAVFLHIFGAIIVLMVAWTTVVGFYVGSRCRGFIWPSVTLGALVFLQIWIGVATLVVRVPKADHGQLSTAQVWWPTVHLAIGALILAVSFILTLKSFRLLKQGAPAADGEPSDRANAGPGWSDYVELTKPRIMTMVLVTTTFGFFLGADGWRDWPTLLFALVGVGLATAGSAVLNNYLERDTDTRMARTRDRVLPTGVMPPENALGFGITLLLAGLFALVTAVNLLTAFLVLLAAFLYVVVYTPMKRLTWLNTTFGAIPGAIPPLCGWAAACGRLDVGAWVLFGILFAWQHPHFFAIAWMFREDYQNAGFKMLPVVEPDGRSTFRQTILFSLLLIAVSVLPTAIGMTGWIYATGALVIGFALLAVGLLFTRTQTFADARRLLKASVIYLPLLLILILVDAGI